MPKGKKIATKGKGKSVKGRQVQRKYEVERILDKKVDGTEITYKVKWVGYQTPTWEPSANVAACDELLEEFEKEYAERIRLANSDPEPEPVEPDLEKHIKKSIPKGFFPITIMGSAVDSQGGLFFAVVLQSKNKKGKLNKIEFEENVHLISGSVLKERYPLLLIDYYERHAYFKRDGTGTYEKPKLPIVQNQENQNGQLGENGGHEEEEEMQMEDEDNQVQNGEEDEEEADKENDGNSSMSDDD